MTLQVLHFDVAEDAGSTQQDPGSVGLGSCRPALRGGRSLCVCGDCHHPSSSVAYVGEKREPVLTRRSKETCTRTSEISWIFGTQNVGVFGSGRRPSVRLTSETICLYLFRLR